MRRRILSCCPLIVLMLSAALNLSAPPQEGSSPPPKPNVVSRELHLIITDNKGHSVDDVNPNDIQVVEDGTPQTIESFDLQELPVSFGLVIDTSGSLRSQFPRVIETAKKIIESNQPNDEAFIVRFVHSSQIALVQDITSDKMPLLAVLGTLRVQPGQTAVLDAVYLSADKLLRADRKQKYRQALVLITDGEERASRTKEEDLLKMLQNAGLKIFIIGLVEELDSEGGFIRRAPRERAKALIERLAKETGGRAFFPRKSEDFQKVVAEITHDLHKQYVVKYRSSLSAQKPFVEIEIKVKEGADKKKRRPVFKPKYKVEGLESLGNDKP